MPITKITELPELPDRPEDGHKGTFGHVLIIAGSRGYSGAAILSASSALRGGAGLVTLACPQEIQPIAAGYEPSYITIGLPHDDQGRINAAAWKVLADQLTKYSVIAIGPGIGQSSDLNTLVLELYANHPGPLVIDADALNLLSKHPDRLTQHAGERVLTPHPGEFSRLTNLETKVIQSEREKYATEFAEKHQVTLILKGSKTIVTDGTNIYENETGNSGMATGGAGDVLTGLIASLIAQKKSGLEAAILGAHLHGLAGDILANQTSDRSIIASDLLKAIGPAFKTRERGQFKHFGN
jgi:NAD(P)H-hydrate epimerase